MKKFFVLGLCFCHVSGFLMGMEFVDMVVNKTVVTLVNKPSAMSLPILQDAHAKDATIYNRAPHIFSKDNPTGETQLLFGEHVIAVGEAQDGWVKVFATEQRIYNNGNLLPIIGFVKKDDLSKITRPVGSVLVVKNPWASIMKKKYWVYKKLIDVSLGTTFVGVEKSGSKWKVQTPLGVGFISCDDVYEVSSSVGEDIGSLRESVLAGARSFLGGPYTWGGCCSWIGYNKNPSIELLDQLSSVDCSGLVYLAFKQKGFRIPRNAHDQYLASLRIDSGSDLQPGDLIFFAREKDGVTRVKHVIFYFGKDDNGCDILLEERGAYELYGCSFVLANECPYFAGKPLSDIKFGEKTSCVINNTVSEQIIYFGTFFTQDKIVEMRRNFLDSVFAREG